MVLAVRYLYYTATPAQVADLVNHRIFSCFILEKDSKSYLVVLILLLYFFNSISCCERILNQDTVPYFWYKKCLTVRYLYRATHCSGCWFSSRRILSRFIGKKTAKVTQWCWFFCFVFFCFNILLGEDFEPRYGIFFIVLTSVADPNPQDPYAFGPPGSGSNSTRSVSGSGSFYNRAKIVRKP